MCARNKALPNGIRSTSHPLPFLAYEDFRHACTHVSHATRARIQIGQPCRIWIPQLFCYRTDPRIIFLTMWARKKKRIALLKGNESGNELRQTDPEKITSKLHTFIRCISWKLTKHWCLRIQETGEWWGCQAPCIKWWSVYKSPMQILSYLRVSLDYV